MTKNAIAKGLAWLLLAVCLVAGMLDFLALVIASGSPHWAGSGLNQAEIDSRMQDHRLAGLLFYV